MYAEGSKLFSVKLTVADPGIPLRSFAAGDSSAGAATRAAWSPQPIGARTSAIAPIRRAKLFILRIMTATLEYSNFVSAYFPESMEEQKRGLWRTRLPDPTAVNSSPSQTVAGADHVTAALTVSLWHMRHANVAWSRQRILAIRHCQNRSPQLRCLRGATLAPVPPSPLNAALIAHRDS